MTEDPGDQVGSVAEEAARLLGLFAGALPDAALRAAGARAAGEPPTEHVCPECGHDPHARTDSVCRVCPVCRVLTVVKAISPETLDKIADIVDLASDALRGLATRQRGSARPAPGAWRAADGAARPAGPGPTRTGTGEPDDAGSPLLDDDAPWPTDGAEAAAATAAWPADVVDRADGDDLAWTGGEDDPAECGPPADLGSHPAGDADRMGAWDPSASRA